jgi:hypothetical protein
VVPEAAVPVSAGSAVALVVVAAWRCGDRSNSTLRAALRVNLKPTRENGSTTGGPRGRCGVAAGPGLEHYEPAFRANGIDAEVLRKLTVDDLKNIGVTRVGDRRKLLEAIAPLSRAP